MRNRSLLVLLVVLAAAAVPGCLGRVVKESVAGGMGAEGVLAEIKRPGSLGAYTSFELGEYTHEMGGQIPRQIWTYLPGKFGVHLQDKGLAGLTGGKALVLRGAILHYEGEGIKGLLFGDFEEVIARVEMVDKASGAVLGTANCIGRTKTTSRKGVENKADGLAKALVKWIESNRR